MGFDTCAGSSLDGDGFNGPSKDKVTDSIKTPGLKEFKKAFAGQDKPASPKPSGGDKAKPGCKAEASFKGTICGRNNW